MNSLSLKISMLVVAFFATATSFAADSLMTKYANEYGVVSSYKEHLVLSFEKSGRLVARSHTEKDILLVNEKHLQFLNTGSVYHSFFNKLMSISGETRVPDGRGYKTVRAHQMRTIPSASASVFYDDAQETEVTFTNLVKGAVTHLEYDVFYWDIHLLPRFYFQNYLPMEEVEFKLTYPRSVEVVSLIKGAEDAGFIRQSREEDKKTITITWKASSVPKAKVYDDAPSVNTYLPHLISYVKSYEAPGSGTQTQVFGTVAELHRFCEDFVKDLKPKPAESVVTAARDMTKDAATDREKAAKIYKWVQQNIRYIAFEDSLGGFIPREPEVVLHRRFGDCKDMAALLRAICRAVGLDAHYVWIGTRHIPYKYEDTPLPIVFNHMIAVVKLDGNWVFMDGTDADVPFGIIPYPIQGKEALIGKDETDYEVVVLPVAAAGTNETADSSFISIDGSVLKGNVAISMKGFPAWDMNSVLKYKVERERKEMFNALTSRGSNKYDQKSFDFKSGEELQVSAVFDIRDYVKKAGDEYFVNMNLLRTYAGSWIDVSERKVPVQLDYPQVMRQVVVLEVPQGYKVNYLPEAQNMNIDGLGSFSVNYQNQGNQVLLVKQIALNTTLIQPASFPDFNKWVAALQRNYKESVVLSPK